MTNTEKSQPFIATEMRFVKWKSFEVAYNFQSLQSSGDTLIKTYINFIIKRRVNDAKRFIPEASAFRDIFNSLHTCMRAEGLRVRTKPG